MLVIAGAESAYCYRQEYQMGDRYFKYYFEGFKWKYDFCFLVVYTHAPN